MKISVITVAYNSAGTIADTVQSVLQQTHVDLEHLVVDGMSTDTTVQTVNALSHPRLFLRSAPDEGIYDAMNKGLSQSTGDVIGFLNADDVFADDHVLERIAKAFAEQEVEACFADLVYVSADNRKVLRYWKSCPFVPGSFSRGWCPAHPTFYIRRNALVRLGLFDLDYRLAADMEFMMRYLQRGRIESRYIPHVHVRMRVGGATNQSWRNILQQNREILHALRKHGARYSVASFWIHKLASRVCQRVAGFFRRG